MLGRYANFPAIIHGTARLSHQISLPRLKQLIIAALQNMNVRKEPYEISVSDHPGVYAGERSFEIGVADDVYFNFLDDAEAKRLLKHLSEGENLSLLDFLVIVSYYYVREGKTIALKFDRHILRFIFYDNIVELNLFHEKGIRRTPLDDFLKYIIDNISQEIKKNHLEPLKIEHLRTL